jgi:hypothetical protein
MLMRIWETYMINMFPARQRLTLGGMLLLCWLASVMSGYSQMPVTNNPAFYGPFLRCFGPSRGISANR